MTISQSKEDLIGSKEQLRGDRKSFVLPPDYVLSPTEKKFLLLAERGDCASVQRLLDEHKGQPEILNINCTDPLNRSALITAIENENMDLIQLLLKAGIMVKDALLHAIKEEYVEAVELLLEWEEKIHVIGEPYSWEAVESSASTFTPDITPLTLAAHMNNYEILKILLDRGATLPMPHDVRCGCDECITSNTHDSLRHSHSRINAYKALSSPSLIALSSRDPLLTAFELSWELRRLSTMESEFRNEYNEMRNTVQTFATSLLDHVRTSYELEIMLNHNPKGDPWEPGERLTLERLKLAIKYKQKAFVAHPNVQQLLAAIWYDGLPGFRRKSMVGQMIEVGKLGAMFPMYGSMYMINPDSKMAQLLKKPFIKFVCHSSSYAFFLTLLALASQRAEFLALEWIDTEWTRSILEEMTRKERGSIPGPIEAGIILYIISLIWREAHSLYSDGLVEYIADLWNIVDFITNVFYMVWISLRVSSWYIVQVAISLNIQQHVHPVIWSLDSLPYDCQKVIPVSRPIGGVLIMAVNSLIYLNQSVPPFGVALNSITKTMTNFPLGQQEDINLVLDRATATFISSNKLVTSLCNGDLYVITLYADSMRAVRSFHFEKCASSVLTTCITVCLDSYLFLGSRLGNSLLLRYYARSQSNDDEPSIKRKKADVTDEDLIELEVYGSEVQTSICLESYSFEVCDSIINIGPCSQASLGEPAYISDELSNDEHDVELLCTSGHGKNGALSVLHRSIKPQLVTTFHLDGYKDMWTVYGENDFHSFMILTNSDSTLVLQTGQEINELDSSGFATREHTVFVCNMNKYVIQVLNYSVRLLKGSEQVQNVSLEFGSPIIHGSSSNPYAVLLTSDGQVIVLTIKSTGRIVLMRPTNFDTVPPTKTLTVYRDVSGLFSSTMPQAEIPVVGPKLKHATFVTDSVEDEEEMLYGDTRDPSSNETPHKPVSNKNLMWWLKFIEQPIPTYWVVLTRDNGYMEIYTLPDFKIKYRAADIDESPAVLKDSLDEGCYFPKRTELIKEILLVPLGYQDKRPLLFVRLDNEVVIYGIHRHPEGTLKMRFHKLTSLLTFQSKSGNRLEGTSLLRYFNRVASYNGVFICGQNPHLVLLTIRGELRCHPLHIDGPIVCFAPFHNVNCSQGFLYFNSDNKLRISILPTHLSYDEPWPLRKREYSQGYDPWLPRENWDQFDPHLVSEGAFAAAMIFSFLKLVHIFSVNPHLGPLQISLGRMIIDIIKFFFIYTLVLCAFGCGLNQLLWYYADLESKKCYHDGSGVPDFDKEDKACTTWRRFANIFETSQSLFWAGFGLVDLMAFDLTGIKSFTRFWGLLLFGSYSVINIIVLLNMLIAMMSNSYQIISERSDMEWKFARSSLWISYFEDGDTVPAPFNLFPSLKNIKRMIGLEKTKRTSGSMIFKSREKATARHDIVMRLLVRRYVTAEQRKSEEFGITEDDVMEIRQDISSMRFEMIDIFKRNGYKTPAKEHDPSVAQGKKGRVMERRLLKDFQIGLVEGLIQDAISSNEKGPKDVFSKIAKAIGRRTSQGSKKKDWNAMVRQKSVLRDPIGSTAEGAERRHRQSVRRYILDHQKDALMDSNKLIEYNPLLAEMAPMARLAYAKFKIPKIKQEYAEENTVGADEVFENAPAVNVIDETSKTKSSIVRPRPKSTRKSPLAAGALPYPSSPSSSSPASSTRRTDATDPGGVSGPQRLAGSNNQVQSTGAAGEKLGDNKKQSVAPIETNAVGRPDSVNRRKPAPDIPQESAAAEAAGKPGPSKESALKEAGDGDKAEGSGDGDKNKGSEGDKAKGSGGDKAKESDGDKATASDGDKTKDPGKDKDVKHLKPESPKRAASPRKQGGKSKVTGEILTGWL